jgi:hypothetical protein
MPSPLTEKGSILPVLVYRKPPPMHNIMVPLSPKLSRSNLGAGDSLAFLEEKLGSYPSTEVSSDVSNLSQTSSSHQTILDISSSTLASPTPSYTSIHVSNESRTVNLPLYNNIV